MRPFMRGFTLLEVVVVIAIAAIIFIALGALLVTQLNLYGTQDVALELSQNLNNVLRTMEETVGEARDTVPSRTFNSILYTTDNDTLILSFPTIGSDSNPISGQSDYILFRLDINGNLYMEVEPSVGSRRARLVKRLASSVVKLNFIYMNNFSGSVNLIKIELILSRAVGQNLETASGATAIRFRNK